MLYAPRQGTSFLENNIGTTSTEFGTEVAAGGSAHTKNATYTQLIASTSFVSYGITIGFGAVGTAASTNTRTLVDIATGAASSEVVLIPNLMCGQAGSSNSASSGPVYYHFPIIIPQGVRLSATSQSLAAADTVRVSVYLHQHPVPGKWYGTRVTDYGTNTADSTGTSHSPGNGSYATTTQLSASTANPIKYLQLGSDLLTNTNATTLRGLIRIAAMSSTNYIVSGLPYRESTTLEHIGFTQANFILSHMNFNIPAGQYLGIGAMRNAAAETRGFALYGVD
jgi:hypothetical protein